MVNRGSPVPILSVVIPTLDEVEALPRALASVGDDPRVEVVISDGGSRDGTLERVPRGERFRVVRGPAGRGGQLDRGAEAALAPRLLFLHADCRLPAGWLPAVLEALDDPAVALACFRLHTEPAGPGAGVLRCRWLRLLDLRSRLGLLPYGDQGHAVRREVFEALGGYPPIPLMEDLAFARAAARRGRIRTIPLEIRTTARRFERYPVRTRLMTATFPVLFRMGVSPHTLARWYRNVR